MHPLIWAGLFSALTGALTAQYHWWWSVHTDIEDDAA